jgi:hypothetical protein
VKQVALLEQKIELQSMQNEESKDQAQMQKDLYDAMLNTIKESDNPSSVHHQVQLAQKIYEANIKELKDRHEAHIKETIQQFSQKWESLYAYIKDAERLLDEMDNKRKRERKELLKEHETETQTLNNNFKDQIAHLRRKLKSYKAKKDLFENVRFELITYRTHPSADTLAIIDTQK